MVVGCLHRPVVSIFDLSNAAPTVPIVTLTNPTSLEGDYFGVGVAIDGTSVLLEAPGNDANGNNSGAAYLYTVAPTLRTKSAPPDMTALSWSPTNAPGYVLQWCDDLLSSNWFNAPSGTTNPVSISTTNSARFYRLALP